MATSRDVWEPLPAPGTAGTAVGLFTGPLGIVANAILGAGFVGGKAERSPVAPPLSLSGEGPPDDAVNAIVADVSELLG